MRARYYDPQLGRFVSEDPLGLAAGINPYAYTGNDPVNFRDPTGEGCERDLTRRAVDAMSSPVGAELDVVPVDETGREVGAAFVACGGETTCTIDYQIWYNPVTGVVNDVLILNISCEVVGGQGGHPGGSPGGGPGSGGTGQGPNPPKEGPQGPSCPLTVPPVVQAAGVDAYSRSLATGKEQANAVYGNKWEPVAKIIRNGVDFVRFVYYTKGLTALTHGHLQIGPDDHNYGTVSPDDIAVAVHARKPFYAYSKDSISVAYPDSTHMTCAR
jgi:hypothetical protein